MPIRKKVLISYRRTDSMSASSRLFERLAARYGKPNVFKDIDSIPGAADFPKAIMEAISQCALQLVVIGQHWLEARDGQGRRRLDDPSDLVRLEIEAALKEDVPVMPELVEDRWRRTWAYTSAARVKVHSGSVHTCRRP